MRVAWLIACSACWTGSTTTVTEVSGPKASRVCEVRDPDVTLSGSAKLSVSGRTFAEQFGEFARFDVAFREAVAHVKLENELFVLEGDLDLAELTMRTRDAELRDGWVEVRSARARRPIDDDLRIEVELPEGLEPKSVPFTLPCSGLTFAAPPDPIETTDLEAVEVPIQTQLRPRPDGPAVARVIGYVDPDDKAKGLQPLEAFVLERRGSMTKLRFEGSNPVVAWVSSLALRTPTGSARGGFGFGRTGIGRSPVSCRRDVSIYARVDGRVVRVGRVKKEVQFYLHSNAGDDLDIDLGLPKADVRAFLKQAEFEATCDR
jgi:hypothetical protein